MQVIHLGTKVLTQFGLLDTGGNLLEVREASVEFKVIDRETFASHADNLRDTWEQLRQQSEESAENASVSDKPE